MTYAEYCALPDDGNRYEVIAGELVLLPTPNRMHQAVCRNLAVALGMHVEPRDAKPLIEPKLRHLVPRPPP